MDEMNTITLEDMSACVDKMTEAQATYLKILISRVVRCFSNPQHHAVLVFQQDDEQSSSICSINTDEPDAYHMLQGAANALSMADMSDAPAKEMFN